MSNDYDDIDKPGEAATEASGRKKPVLLEGSRHFMRKKLEGKAFLIPSLITVVGLFCGFLAIVSAIKGRFDYATKCIAMAIILDGLDGRVARRLNATSAFGREFDSLSDLVAFGVAPAVLVYCWAFIEVADEFGVLVCFMFVACAATRLARFNIVVTGEKESKARDDSFEGLPTPAAAAATAAIVYAYPYAVDHVGAVGALALWMFGLALLMVSTLPFLSPKKVRLTDGNPRMNFVLLCAAVALVWKYSQLMIVAVSVGYSVSGVVIFLWRLFVPLRSEEALERSA